MLRKVIDLYTPAEEAARPKHSARARHAIASVVLYPSTQRRKIVFEYIGRRATTRVIALLL